MKDLTLATTDGFEFAVPREKAKRCLCLKPIVSGRWGESNRVCVPFIGERELRLLCTCLCGELPLDTAKKALRTGDGCLLDLLLATDFMLFDDLYDACVAQLGQAARRLDDYDFTRATTPDAPKKRRREVTDADEPPPKRTRLTPPRRGSR